MSQTLKPTANAAQIEHWNAVAGTTWAQFHELLDRQIEALGSLIESFIELMSQVFMLPIFHRRTSC